MKRSILDENGHDLRFKHIQSILDNTINKGGKYPSELNRDEVKAAVEKAKRGEYSKPQIKFINKKLAIIEGLQNNGI